MTNKETALPSCPVCGTNEWRGNCSPLYYYCSGCATRIPKKVISDRPEEDRLRFEVECLKAEIERLRKPHPTCETCENAPCHKVRVLQCSDSEGEYGMDVETEPINYCDQHTALKKGDPDANKT